MIWSHWYLRSFTEGSKGVCIEELLSFLFFDLLFLSVFIVYIYVVLSILETAPKSFLSWSIILHEIMDHRVKVTFSQIYQWFARLFRNHHLFFTFLFNQFQSFLCLFGLEFFLLRFIYELFLFHLWILCHFCAHSIIF